jgi:hypothetical protein
MLKTSEWYAKEKDHKDAKDKDAKESKETKETKDGKESKDGLSAKEKERELSSVHTRALANPLSAFMFHEANTPVEPRETEPASGRAFIRVDERPTVGARIIKQASEDAANGKN